jgi:hypothetical protein
MIANVEHSSLYTEVWTKSTAASSQSSLLRDCIKVGGGTLAVVEGLSSELRQPLAEEHFEPIVEYGATNLEEKVGTLC